MSDLQQQDRSASFAQGLKLIQQLGGTDRPAVLDLFASIGEAEFGEQCVGFIYGDVYHRPGLRYSHAIWHVFVAGGSVCHFFAVLWHA